MYFKKSSYPQISPVQNDLSKDVNINCSEDKVTSPDTDKSEEIRNLSEGVVLTCPACYRQPRGRYYNQNFHKGRLKKKIKKIVIKILTVPVPS